jgi:ApaG protein
MISLISEGIEITVVSYFQEMNANVHENEFSFAYKIIIENHNPFAVQLLHRHWNIVDSWIDNREVDGEGVVGLTPVLKEGSVFSYVSGCYLRSEIGKMYGYYIMQNLETNKTFKVTIPEFLLITPGKLN